MKTIFSWRPEKEMFPRPALKKFRRFAEAAAELSRSGIRSGFSVTFVSAEEMKKANRELVGHKGLTDVICFDYREALMPSSPDGSEETGVADRDFMSEVDLIVCPAAALLQAEKRHIAYSRELALYVVHGLLHAAGCDDLQPALKRKMRRREKQTMDALEKLFDFSEIFPEAIHTKD